MECEATHAVFGEGAGREGGAPWPTLASTCRVTPPCSCPCTTSSPLQGCAGQDPLQATTLQVTSIRPPCTAGTCSLALSCLTPLTLLQLVATSPSPQPLWSVSRLPPSTHSCYPDYLTSSVNAVYQNK